MTHPTEISSPALMPRRVTWRYIFLLYAGSDLVAMFVSWAAFLFLILGGLHILMPTGSMDAFRAAVRANVFLSGLVLILFLAPFALYPLARFVLRRRRAELLSIMTSLCERSAEGESWQTRKQLIQALRFHGLACKAGSGGSGAVGLGLAKTRYPWVRDLTPILARFVVEHCRQRQGAREVIQLLKDVRDFGAETWSEMGGMNAIDIGADSGVEDELYDKLVPELGRLSPGDLKEVFEHFALVDRSRKGRWNLCRMFASCAAPDWRPDLLAELVGDEYDFKTTTDQVVKVIKVLPRGYLARAVLVALSKRGRRARDLKALGKRLIKHRRWPAAVSHRLTPAEPVAYGLLRLASPLGTIILVPGALAMLLILAPVWLFGIVFAQTYDILHLGSLRRRGIGALDDIVRALRGEQLAIVGRLEAKRVKDSLLAATILTPGQTVQPRELGFSKRAIGRVLARLQRGGLLANRSEVLVRVMGSRELVQALATSRGRDVGRARRAIGHDDHERQLLRVLPFESGWKRAVIVASLSMLCLGIWSAVLAESGPPGTVEWLSRIGVWWLPILLIGLVALQHMGRAPGVELKGPWIFLLLFFFANKFAGGSESTASHVFFAISGISVRRIDLWNLAVAIMTNGLVPELIAQWRGSNILYPTSRRLWGQRLLACFAAVGLVILLAQVSAL